MSKAHTFTLIAYRISSREFPGYSRFLVIFPVFPRIKIWDPRDYREIPVYFGF